MLLILGIIIYFVRIITIDYKMFCRLDNLWWFFCRRFGHTSAYDKNVDEQVRPSVVPDDVIEPQSDKYWEPNPQTGVFGPASGTEAAGTEGGFHSSPANGRDQSVLEEKAWFRPTSLEDCEKPNHT